MYQLTDSKEVSRRDMDKELTGARETRSRTNRLISKDRLKRERTKC
mgnify:CR=1 FL=1